MESKHEASKVHEKARRERVPYPKEKKRNRSESEEGDWILKGEELEGIEQQMNKDERIVWK